MATNLPHLPDVERLSPLVVRILGGNPGKFTLQGTNTYLLSLPSSQALILIDTAQGFPSWPSHLKTHLSTLPSSTKITHILLTHHHADHIGGIADTKSLFPSAIVYKHPAPPTPNPNYDYPALLSGIPITALEDGQTFTLPSSSEAGKPVTLRAIHTPGHAADHMAFLLSDDGTGTPALFTGDAVLGHGTAVFEDLGSYMASLQKMLDVIQSASTELGEGRKVRAYPGHGAVIEDAAGKVEEYLKHRERREGEVFGVLENGGGEGGMTPMEVVKVVYKAYPVELHEPAEGGVRLILAKLEGEGRVERVSGVNGEEEGGRWRVVKGKGSGGGGGGGEKSAL